MTSPFLACSGVSSSLIHLTHRWEGEAQPACLVMSELCAAKELPLPPGEEPHPSSFRFIRSQMQPQITCSVPRPGCPHSCSSCCTGADSTGPSEGLPNGLKDLRTQEPCFLSISRRSTGQIENELRGHLMSEGFWILWLHSMELCDVGKETVVSGARSRTREEGNGCE